MNDWLATLKEHIQDKGLAVCAQELGLSKSALSLAANGKYPANTGAIEERVRRLYGASGVACPVLGDIPVAACAAHYAKAQVIGLKAGSPRTLRLYKQCLSCPVRAAK